MTRKFTAFALTTLLAAGLSAGAASAEHHEGSPKKDDHENHEGHDAKPKDEKGHAEASEKGHGDHHDHGEKPKADTKK
jgi:hypothetical protein